MPKYAELNLPIVNPIAMILSAAMMSTRRRKAQVKAILGDAVKQVMAAAAANRS
jgi:isocitrate/isopropylmalate dehydrogenase